MYFLVLRVLNNFFPLLSSQPYYILLSCVEIVLVYTIKSVYLPHPITFLYVNLS